MEARTRPFLALDCVQDLLRCPYLSGFSKFIFLLLLLLVLIFFFPAKMSMFIDQLHRLKLYYLHCLCFSVPFSYPNRVFFPTPRYRGVVVICNVCKQIYIYFYCCTFYVPGFYTFITSTRAYPIKKHSWLWGSYHIMWRVWALSVSVGWPWRNSGPRVLTWYWSRKRISGQRDHLNLLQSFFPSPFLPLTLRARREWLYW